MPKTKDQTFIALLLRKIKKACLECCCENREEVLECPSRTCPLFLHRLGTRSTPTASVLRSKRRKKPSSKIATK